MTSWVWLAGVAGLGAILLLAPRWGLLRRWRLRQAGRQRALVEDALKHLFVFAQRGQPATPESLAGGLRISARKVVDLINRMEANGLMQSSGGQLQLREEGRRRALQVVRAHRLWERYLADELRVPLEKVHGSAERAEHKLSSERLDALEAHLGHPLRDPHGDPIPQADGSVEPLLAVPLTDWPLRHKGVIAHVEDEPEFLLPQILQLGLSPGSVVEIVESGPESITVVVAGSEVRLSRALAANVHVRPAVAAPLREATVPLSELPLRRKAQVVAIDPEFRGLGRRRLLDLGLTPAAEVMPELTTPAGDPRAYRVRGTLVALRNEQARHVWVRPLMAEAARN
jgi:DtxR family Mn-dependent transcriptional regulator